jgi:hypothetical protein
MFKFLKDRREARKRADEEDKPRATATPAPAATRAPAAAQPPPRAARDVGRDMDIMARQLAGNLRREGITLDFTPASLPLVDGMLATRRRDLQGASAEKRRTRENLIALQVGAYVGEVLRQKDGGVWIKGADGLPAVDLGTHLAPTVVTAVGLLAEGHITMPEGQVETFAAYYDIVSKSQRNWLDTAVRGAHPNLESLKKEMSDDGRLAEWILAQARIALKTARTKWDKSLDFSPASLEAVEGVLTQMHDLLAKAKPGERPTDAQIEGAAKLWGVYVGEVVRRHYGGRWTLTRPDGVLQLEIKGAKVFPLRKVQKRIVEGPADAIPFYFHAMEKALTAR